jgi:hypothetical protein
LDGFFVEQRPRAARDHQEIERLAPRALEIPIERGKRTVAALDLVAVLADQHDLERIGRRLHKLEDLAALPPQRGSACARFPS